MTLSTKTDQRNVSSEAVPFVELSDCFYSLRDYLGYGHGMVTKMNNIRSNNHIMRIISDLGNSK